MKKILLILFLCIITIKIHNTTPKMGVARVEWLNHPHGITIDFRGHIHSRFFVAVGEANSGKIWKIILGEGYSKIGNKFRVTWNVQQPYDFTVEKDTLLIIYKP